ncbi:MAG: hypothetical protein ACRDZ9_09460 [Acidimicrobiales bacterium]
MGRLLAHVDLLAAISWSPEIRNILSLLVGLGVLVGSLYLIVATNTGIRTGVLIALASLFGWMMIMGIIWWIYGIGMKGEAPSWHVADPNTELAQMANEEANRLRFALEDLPTPQEVIDDHPELLEEVLPPDAPPEREATLTLGELIEADPSLVDEYGIDEALGGWTLLAVSDRQRGDALAVVQANLGPEGAALAGEGEISESADYVVRDTFSLGGKPQRDDNSMWGRVTYELSTWWHWSHPTHYAIVQVAPAVEQEAEPGEAAPPARIDESEPVLSVLLVRDLGDLRFPAAMVTIIFGVLFGVTCNTLHRRDKAVATARAAAAV